MIRDYINKNSRAIAGLVLLFSLILIFLLWGFAYSAVKAGEQHLKKINAEQETYTVHDREYSVYRFKIIVIDGCQYLMSPSLSIAHKGDCTNLVHKSNN